MFILGLWMSLPCPCPLLVPSCTMGTCYWEWCLETQALQCAMIQVLNTRVLNGFHCSSHMIFREFPQRSLLLAGRRLESSDPKKQTLANKVGHAIDKACYFCVSHDQATFLGKSCREKGAKIPAHQSVSGKVPREIEKGCSPITGRNHPSFARLAEDSQTCQPPSGGGSAA